MADTDGEYASAVAPGGLSCVYLWVDVPAVTGGAPLSRRDPDSPTSHLRTRQGCDNVEF